MASPGVTGGSDHHAGGIGSPGDGGLIAVDTRTVGRRRMYLLVRYNRSSSFAAFHSRDSTIGVHVSMVQQGAYISVLTQPVSEVHP